MRKKLVDAIPGLKLDAAMQEAVSEVWVEKISHSSDLTDLNIVISSEKPIPAVVFSLDDVIKRQLFPDNELNIHIIGKIDLDAMASQAKNAARAAGSSSAVAQKSSASSARGRNYSGARKRGNKKEEGILYGSNTEGHVIFIESIVDEMDDVVIEGRIFGAEEKETRKGDTIFTFNITDETDSISGKIFCRKPQHEDEEDKAAQVRPIIKNGAVLRIRARVEYDTYTREIALTNIRGIKEAQMVKHERVDKAEVKRVELHCHTKMSDMDAVSDVSDIMKRAAAWGHKALAITDHGVVQAFPDADHTKLPKEFKIIYGLEGYLVDDTKELIIRERGQDFHGTFVVFDIETTGLSYKRDTIIEIGAVKISDGQIVDRFSEFVNPEREIPYEITKLTGIRQSMVADAGNIREILPRFLDFCGDAVIVAHNAEFDTSFIAKAAADQGFEYAPTIADTLTLARMIFTDMKRFKLDTIAKKLGVVLVDHHRAVNDAEATAGIFLKFMDILREKGAENLKQVNELGAQSDELIKKAKSYHIILLAKNDLGRINLYKLVSMSHLRYFAGRPRIPKSELIKLREGLIIGSACEAGELFRAIHDGASDEQIRKIASFYDYLEIQPVGNNKFLIADEKSYVKDFEDLRNLNRKIVALGDELKKPVCATCDVHFLDPEDELYRRIILYGQNFKDADEQPPLYLHTTDEMLDEFSYLGSEKAYEVVVENTNMIADMCDRIHPVRPDKKPPIIENSDVMLREMCYETAHDWYGDPLPEIIQNRLDRELTSIISNGYAVMYIIAYKLIAKSNSDGYLVGSRGSVGSSFVATMAHITEVNPLPPHYRCPNCKHSDFEDQACKDNALGAGCDMPDKACPVCGTNMIKDGFDIPFETFLGFKGNKEPDIDLNFSSENQASAHKETEVIFGEGQTFKAGTVSTMADKTAYGYVKNYFQDHSIQKRSCEIDRITNGCVGIRRSTGQHPGGIIVLPYGEEINTFTPIQHPANDMTTDIITTHFDYHKIDANLLKLDLLGHDDPTMIRRMMDLTGLDATKIPLDDPTVMKLFKGTEPLGVQPSDLFDGCRLGVLGVPEFGTDFAMQMLIDAKPKSFADLVRIAGLAHGTMVWQNNAELIVKGGKAPLKDVICTRDDIMLYLISMGLEPSESFDIMEAVRKGKVAGGKADKWPAWKEDMISHGVPDWYIDSCQKIQYMFPKAHAAAYVMMAWRVAWFKINRPLEYYCAFFSIRATSFSFELMCQGRDAVEAHLREYKEIQNTRRLTDKEKGTVRDMRIVQEFYARGFEFMPMDIYKADATRFQVIDGKLLPSFASIEGMGEKAAESVAAAAKGGQFLSIDDFRDRTKISQTLVDKMNELGMLGNLPKSNQFSFFDSLGI